MIPETVSLFSKASVITSHPHLPLAIEYQDQDSLKDIRDSDLSKMLAECADWCQLMEEFRGSLVTPAALTLWRVLIQDETATVAETYDRIEAEISDRANREPSDTVPAPGEDFQALDGFSAAHVYDDRIAQ
jgi:hypothetical protein